MSRQKCLIIVATAALAAHGALATDPEFNTKVQLLGSAVYNWCNDPSSSASLEDWDVNVDENGSIAMGDPGLVYTPNNESSGNSVRHQFKQAFVVEDGVAWARFRISVSDVDKMGLVFGFHSQDTNPFSTEPDQAAYFIKAPTDTTLTAKVKNGANDDDDPGPTLADGGEFDLVIKVDANGGTTRVDFWWRCGCGFWSTWSTTTNTPSQTASLRFSAAVSTIDTAEVETVTVSIFETEFDK
jgi:hypothetical protein